MTEKHESITEKLSAEILGIDPAQFAEPMRTRPPKSAARAITANIRRIIDAMKSIGLSSAEVSYSGSGDSGESGSVDASPRDIANWEETPVSIWVEKVTYTDGEYVTTFSLTDCTMAAALDRLADLAIGEAGHNGFENGTGGGGTLRLDVEGQCSLDHYDNVIHEEHTETTFDIDLETA